MFANYTRLVTRGTFAGTVVVDNLNNFTPVASNMGLSYIRSKLTLRAQLNYVGVLAVEMESAALYTIAARYKAKALTILTVSDHIKRGEATTSQEREQTFSQMVEIALDTAIA